MLPHRLAAALLALALLPCCASAGSAAGARCPTSLAPAAAPGAGGAAPPADALAALNAASVALYRDARARLAESLSPVIVARGTRLSLLRHGVQTDAPPIPGHYATLKSVAHVALGLHVLLSVAPGPLEPARRAALEAHRALLRAADPVLDTRGLTDPQRVRQHALLARCAEFLDAVLAAGAVAPDALQGFERSVAPWILENVTEAARVQVDWIHAAVEGWQRALTPEERAALRVVVLGNHMARDGEVATQYFLRRFDERAEGGRVVYAESVRELPQALVLVASHVLDAELGVGFFADAGRMHRELLGDGAAEYLRGLLPR